MSTIVDIKTQLHVTKFGLNKTTTAGEAIQDEGGAIVINTSAAKVRIKSGGNVADVAGGAGAEAVAIFGVDGNWDFVSETITTKGALVSEFSVIFFVFVVRGNISDSGDVFNVGNIIIETAAAVVMCQIMAGYGQTERAVFPVFAGYEMHLTKFRFEGDKNSALSGEMSLYVYTLDQGIAIVHSFPFLGSHHEIVEWEKFHKVIPEKSLIWASPIALSASAVIGASFDGDLFRR
jgi:hypothetical protein